MDGWRGSPSLRSLILVAACALQVCQAQSLLSTTSSAVTPLSTDGPLNLTNSDSLTSALTLLSPCASTCVTRNLQEAECYDTQCFCFNETLSKEVTACVDAGCNFPDEIATRNITEFACHRPKRDRGHQFDVVLITMICLSVVFVTTRIVYKRFFSTKGQLDAGDWFIVTASVSGLPMIVIGIKGLHHNGLGSDVWTLQISTIIEFAKYIYAMQILYVIVMTLIKLSLLCFYLSIFSNKGTRQVLWGTIIVVVAYGIASVIPSIFQCTPVHFYWTRYQQDSDGSCIDINVTGWCNAALSVALDVWMIGIPLFQLKRLKLHWKKKCMAAIMFLTGAIITIVSILRLQSVSLFYTSENITWDLWPICLWSVVEVNVGFMCVCLPTIRVILIRLWPHKFESSNLSCEKQFQIIQLGSGSEKGKEEKPSSEE